jgi:adenosylhomocysteine nucleosidase
MAKPLVVVALRQEAAYLEGVNVLLAGIGKVSSGIAVTAALAKRRPSYVLNVGTAGALRDGLEGVHRVGRVLEHDFDTDAIGALVGVPLPGEIVLDETAPIVLATGDAFVSDPVSRAQLAARAHLVDMEGYAVARACAAAGVRCEMVKVVSDDASDGAARSWQDAMDAAAVLIAAVVAAALG